ncbi:glycoside hydrolase [Cladochytrium replicatum]|nr:glycoside hydrolase [Cladochytrium replicatum]
MVKVEFESFLYGADYNPEQWSRDVWDEDMRLMKKAGVNMVSLGIFSWAQIEPQPGVYRFEWLDDIINLLHKNDIMVDLATTVAAPPPWLSKLYPDSRPVTSKGVRLEIGSRQTYCPSHSAFRIHAREIITKVAQRYAAHPAVKMWHINNEYACHIYECYCDRCAVEYRNWLEKKYGSIEKVNESWMTAFWSQQYGKFDEIQPPRDAPTYPNPGQQLDWRRFSSDNLLSLLDMEGAIVREHSKAVGRDLPIVTNFLGISKMVDLFKWAQHEDLVSDDRYPDPFDPYSHVEAAMNWDMMRSLRHGQRFLLMEQAPNAVNWRQINSAKKPGLMRLLSFMAVAHGAMGVMFFQWRASKGGAEKFHSGMVPHAGENTRTYREIAELGADLIKYKSLRTAKVHADVAILFDFESWWGLELDSKPNTTLQQLVQTRKYYDALRALGLTVDFLHPDDSESFKKYRMIVAPQLYAVGEKAIENINAFVNNGGTLVLSLFSGVVNKSEQIYLGGYPAPFRSTLGMWVEEWAPLDTGATRAVTLWDGSVTKTTLWGELVHLEGATPLATYAEDYLSGSAAVTSHTSGSGRAYYVSADLDADALKKLVKKVCEDSTIAVSEVPLTLDITVSKTEDGASVVHLLNFGSDPVEVGLPSGGVSLQDGSDAGEKISVGHMEMVLVKYDGVGIKTTDIKAL